MESDGFGPTTERRAMLALLRLPFFVAGWIMAFMFLSTLWVAFVFAIWVAWIVPRVRAINAQFQNEAEPRELP